MQIDTDDRFQRVQWRVQRAAWAFLTLVPFAALGGAFGGGPVSQRTVASGEVAIDYERFARRGARSSLTLTRTQDHATAPLVVRIDTGFVRVMHPERFMPTPRRTRHTGAWIELEFGAAGDPVTSRIEIEHRPYEWGHVTGRISVDGRELPPIRVLVWP